MSNQEAPETDPKYKYYAFISYSRKDSDDADWFHAGVERFHVPAALPRPEDAEPLPKRLKLFRDKTDLPVRSASFVEDIGRALRESRFLVVLCSPNASRGSADGNHYVDWEIREFMSIHGEEYARSHILPVILSGTIDSPDPERECLPPAFKELGAGFLEHNFPVLESPRKGYRTAKQARSELVLKSLSFLTRIEYSVLNDRFQKEQGRRLRRMLAASSLALAVVLAMAAWAAIEADRARKSLARSDFQEASRLIDERQSGLALAYLASSIGESPNGSALDRLYGMLRGRSWLVRLEDRAPKDSGGRRVAASSAFDMELRLAEDGALTVIDAARDRATRLSPRVAGLRYASFSPDGEIAFAVVDGQAGRRCMSWMTADGSARGDIALGPRQEIIGTSDHGSYLVATAPDGRSMRVLASKDGRAALDAKLAAGMSWDGFAFDEDERLFACVQRTEDGDAADRGNGPLASLGEPILSRFAIKVSRLEDGASLCAMEKEGILGHCSLSPDGRRLAYAVSNGLSGGWKLVDKPVRAGAEGWETALPGMFRRLAFDPDGIHLAVELALAPDNALRIYDVYRGPTPSSVIPLGNRKVRSWAFSRDGRRLALLADGNELSLYGVEDGEEVVERRLLAAEAYSVAFSRDDRALIVSGAEGLERFGIRISPEASRAIESGYSPAALTGVIPSGETGALALVLQSSGDGDFIEMRSAGESEPGALGDRLRPLADAINTGAFAPGSRRLVLGSGDPLAPGSKGKVLVFDIPEGKVLEPKAWLEREPVAIPFAVSRLSVSRDGKLALVSPALFSSEARLVDLAKGVVLPFSLSHEGSISDAAFSADGGLLLTTGGDKTVKAWRASTGESAWSAGLESFPECLAVSEDGKIACGMRIGDVGGRVEVLTAAGKTIWESRSLPGGVSKLAFDRSGKLLAVAYRGGEAVVLDAATGRPRSQALRNDGDISALAFAERGEDLVLCVGGRGNDGSGYVERWDPLSSKQVGDKVRHARGPVGVWVSQADEIVSWSERVVVTPSPMSARDPRARGDDCRSIAGELGGWVLNEWRVPEEYRSASARRPSTGALSEAFERILEDRPDDLEAPANRWLSEARDAAKRNFLAPYTGERFGLATGKAMEWESKDEWATIRDDPEAFRIADFRTRTLVAAHPEAGIAWRERGIFLKLSGRIPEAKAALGKAASLASSDAETANQLHIIAQAEAQAKPTGDSSAAVDPIATAQRNIEKNPDATIDEICDVASNLLSSHAMRYGTEGLKEKADWVLAQLRRRTGRFISFDDQLGILGMNEDFARLMLIPAEGPRVGIEFANGLIALFDASDPAVSRENRAVLDSYLAFFLLVDGKTEEASKIVERVLKDDGDLPMIVLTFSIDQAYALDMQGQRAKAAALLREMLGYDDEMQGEISKSILSDFYVLRKRGRPLRCEDDLRAELLKKVSAKAAKGLLVEKVVAGGQGELGGVKAGDRLVGYDGYPILDLAAFIRFRQMEKFDRIDETRELRLSRGGDQITLRVKPGLLGLQLSQ